MVAEEEDWMSSWFLRVLLVACCAGTGCGKAVDPTPATPDGGSGDDGSDDDGGGDGGADDGADDDDGADVDAAVASDTRGRIEVFTRNYTDINGDNPLDSTVTAQFGSYETEDCVEELAGSDCQVVRCTDREPPSPAPQAGNITIEGVQQAVIMPGDDGFYAPLKVDQTLLSDGGNLSVFGVGGEVPEFSILDLTVPYSLGFGGDVPTSAGPIELSASADYNLFWNGISATDTMIIKMTGPADGDGVTTRIECSVTAGVGAVTITADALGLLPQGEVQFESLTRTSTRGSADDYDIELIATVVSRLGDDAAGDWAAGTVLLGP